MKYIASNLFSSLSLGSVLVMTLMNVYWLTQPSFMVMYSAGSAFCLSFVALLLTLVGATNRRLIRDESARKSLLLSKVAFRAALLSIVFSFFVAFHSVECNLFRPLAKPTNAMAASH